ncbi:unnamed protein product [Lactuca saligna]|uniref:Uncharacterized protein n=1 Tax=Lactuca saligna TaxID=75948 RepID=A0AA35Z5M9_LACSI|nr:unnamed protein product [Lactuca saligna]
MSSGSGYLLSESEPSRNCSSLSPFLFPLITTDGRREKISIYDVVLGDVIPLKIGDQVSYRSLLMQDCKLGAWVLKPRNSEPTFVVHFVGGIFVGAAPQLTYRLFLERLSERGALVIVTPYARTRDKLTIKLG